MIKILRVDNRLLHGQVAFTWTSSVGADSILIACDTLHSDPLRLTAIKMSKPAGIKLVIKNVDDAIESINSGVTDRYQLMVIVESIGDAYRMMKGSDQFNAVSIGFTGKKVGSTTLTNWVFATPQDIELMKELIDENKKVEFQNVPTTKSIDAAKLIYK